MVNNSFVLFCFVLRRKRKKKKKKSFAAVVFHLKRIILIVVSNIIHIFISMKRQTIFSLINTRISLDVQHMVSWRLTRLRLASFRSRSWLPWQHPTLSTGRSLVRGLMINVVILRADFSLHTPLRVRGFPYRQTEIVSNLSTENARDVNGEFHTSNFKWLI